MFNRQDRRTTTTILALCGVIALAGCAQTRPKPTSVRNPELPDYKVENQRIAAPIDLYIEPRILALSHEVTPHSDKKTYRPIPMLVGPALERALMGVTRQHFSHMKQVTEYGGTPVLIYELLTYKPVVEVKPGVLSTHLNVSARLALQLTINAASGETLYSTTAIGTSHVSDTKIAAGDGLKDAPAMVEAVTRDAIIDAMYEISKIFGNDADRLASNVKASEVNPTYQAETFNDVVMYLKTRTQDPT